MCWTWNSRRKREKTERARMQQQVDELRHIVVLLEANLEEIGERLNVNSGSSDG